MPVPLLLDVDTGVDDAMAIALATRLDKHRLVGITTVAGNVPIERTTVNTLRVLDWLGAEVPVYRGMSAPLARPLSTAGHVHGDDGLGGWEAPVARRRREPETAPETIVRLAREHQGEIVFAFVGPLTNLAVALSLEPRIAEWVSRLVIMGGAFHVPGNETAHAEFNVYVDPEAAAAVARSGMQATWVGLDVTHQVWLDREAWNELSGDEPSCVLLREVCRSSFVNRGRDVVYLHDPLAVAVVEHPEFVESESGTVVVDTGHHATGRTRLTAAVAGERPAQVATRVDATAFEEIFRRIVTKKDEGWYPRPLISRTI